MSALTLGGTWGGQIIGIGGSNSVPNIPVGLVSALALEGTEYLHPSISLNKSNRQYSTKRGEMRGILDTKNRTLEKTVIGEVEDTLQLVRNIFPESIDFESYLNNFKGLLFSNASLISKFIYNLELINHGYGEDFLSKVINDDENVELMWQGYLLNPEYPQLYKIIGGMCDRCRGYVNGVIKENKKARMDVYSAHPSIQQTFREPNPSIMTCGGPYFGPSNMLATMLPPSYKTEGTGTSKGITEGTSKTNVTSKDISGNPVVIEVENEEATDNTKGTTEEHARNIMNIPNEFTKHLGLDSTNLEIEFKDDVPGDEDPVVSKMETPSDALLVTGAPSQVSGVKLDTKDTQRRNAKSKGKRGQSKAVTTEHVPDTDPDDQISVTREQQSLVQDSTAPSSVGGLNESFYQDVDDE
jgi:hypothetical protein